MNSVATVAVAGSLKSTFRSWTQAEWMSPVITTKFFLVWRANRADIATWPLRARASFYGAALLIVADVGVAWLAGARGLNLLAFLGVLVGSGFAMFRIWRDMHHYS